MDFGRWESTITSQFKILSIVFPKKKNTIVKKLSLIMNWKYWSVLSVIWPTKNMKVFRLMKFNKIAFLTLTLIIVKFTILFSN